MARRRTLQQLSDEPASVPTEPIPRSAGQRAVLVLGGLVAVACLGLAGILLAGFRTFERVARVDVDLVEVSADSPENYLLVGSDSRDSIDPDDPNAGLFLDGEFGGQRSDSLLVLRIDPATPDRVDLLSIPRDLWVGIAGENRNQRINVAYDPAQPQRLIDTVENELDIELHHYVEVDFSGFARLVDVLGGVPMFFESPVRDANSGLSIEAAGCHVLSGDEALSFVRSRSIQVLGSNGWEVDGTGDLGRIGRQQLFLQRALDGTRQLGVDDALTLSRLADASAELLTLDETLGAGDLVAIARLLNGLDGEAVVTHALPILPERVGTSDVLLLDRPKARSILNIYRGVPPETISPTAVSVSVLNGSGQRGQATAVADSLASAGFQIDSVADAAVSDLTVTAVQYPPGWLDVADLVARHFSGPTRLEETADIQNILVVTGSELGTISRVPRAPSAVPRPAPTTSAVDSEQAGAGTTATPADATTTTLPLPTTTTEPPVGYRPTGAACTPS